MLIGNIQYSYQFVGKHVPLPELWQEWIKTNNVTNKRLVSALVLYRAYKQKTRYSEACVDSIRTVFGTGFEYGKELPHSAIMYMVLNHMLGCLPKEELVQLASALAMWFIACVPDDIVMIHAPTQQKLPAQLEMAHLLAHEQLNLVYGWLNCKNAADLKNTFPLAVASAEHTSDG